MGLSEMYNAPVPEDVGISIIKEAFNQGITFFDTADIMDLTLLKFWLASLMPKNCSVFP
jgi:aryl-alcohol dehydrogenase-like predicted oxidoreductase